MLLAGEARATDGAIWKIADRDAVDRYINARAWLSGGERERDAGNRIRHIVRAARQFTPVDAQNGVSALLQLARAAGIGDRARTQGAGAAIHMRTGQ